MDGVMMILWEYARQVVCYPKILEDYDIEPEDCQWGVPYYNHRTQTLIDSCHSYIGYLEVEIPKEQVLKALQDVLHKPTPTTKRKSKKQ